MATSLISQHPSTSGLQIALHPLALLTVSDYITRHTLRQGRGPIVGALLGRQTGREISIEHAYEIMISPDLEVDTQWFETKLQLFKETHPSSDLIGWFTITFSPTFAPEDNHVEIHQALLPWNESPLLLLLNPSSISGGGKLPVAVYESIYEAPNADGDKNLVLRFVPLPFTIESGEAEMIGMDSVAKGASSATAATGEGKGKEPATSAATQSTTDLGPAHDELLSNLTAKKNAIQMLNSRIKLLLAYLQSPPEGGENNHQILREIKSLTHARLPLLRPARTEAFKIEKLAEEGDVDLVVLLGAVTRCIEDVRSVGRKSAGMSQVFTTGKKGLMSFGDEGLEYGPPPRRGPRGVGLFGF
ncbi:hypothetical protein FN846DRAFT_930288 [Sphaerosporella brunnea]|uniref:COP9 signalosome complex subunit 6 n=1 Tax=Sphaerosporella brunnea TaxID=1250544 RepID=A0A5J5F8M9_9PEZI|nr:hypothetical protein FN846DRAFT_930288 [Sphaerosporella brunnea]